MMELECQFIQIEYSSEIAKKFHGVILVSDPPPNKNTEFYYSRKDFSPVFEFKHGSKKIQLNAPDQVENFNLKKRFT